MTTATASGPTVADETMSIAHGWRAWSSVVLVGLIAGSVALYVTLVGIVGTFEERDLVEDIITVGEVVLLLVGIIAGYAGARKAPPGPANAVLGAALAGLLAGGALTLLILIGPAVDLRDYLPNASNDLYDLLTFESREEGFWVPALIGIGLGALGGILALLPRHVRVVLALSVGGLIVMGLFSGVLRSPMLSAPLTAGLARDLFASNGLTLTGAILVVAAVVGLYLLHVWLRPAERVRKLPAEQKKQLAIPMSAVLLLIILLVPLGMGPFVASAVALIALYVLMGLGLNITLGLAGLLDLGFVAFFAVGAYTVGLLTSTAEFGIAQWPFWAAIPFAILIAMLFGLVLGLPILGIRGDYLAIATLGFGEIVRLLAGSELLLPWLGGPRGILQIPKPIDVPADHFLSGPNQVYYISLACAAVIAFVAYRLRASRLGRAWVAIREDEDVAEALGVSLVQTKSLAYMLGAAFAGLGGAVFAALFGTLTSASIRLDISIQVVAIIIIGGLGSIPGVVLGAIVLIGLPELFREFAEYRFLLYGIALIIIMRLRPEGLIPSRVGRQEMHGTEDQASAAPPAGEEDEGPVKVTPMTGATGA
jgi:branched-chain amino acid transport system permease protein